MYEFLFGVCILRCLKLCMNFYLKYEFFLMYFKIPYDFTILRSEFITPFPCRVKNTFLTTLV